VEDLASQLPPGRDVDSYYQRLGMVDFEFVAGHAELRGEGAWNVWQTPMVGDLRVTTGYVELKYALPFGTFAAGRLDGMRFSDIADSTGARHSWDTNVTRWEIGAGIHVDHNVLTKLVYQSTRLEGSDDKNPALFAAQASITF
jgi:hypothetical protein